LSTQQELANAMWWRVVAVATAAAGSGSDAGWLSWIGGDVNYLVFLVFVYLFI
jgi:hypothetical protein